MPKFRNKYSLAFEDYIFKTIEKIDAIREIVSYINAEKDNKAEILNDYAKLLIYINSFCNEIDKQFIENISYKEDTGVIDIIYKNGVLPNYKEQLN